MKSVMIRYYDKNNLGDDLLVEVVLSRYKNKFITLTSNKSNSLKTRKNLRIQLKGAKFYFSLFLDKCRGTRNTFLRRIANGQDTVVYVGGSIFMENNDLKKWDRERKFYDRLRTPYFILGSNVEPSMSQSFAAILERIFKGAKDVCFRDRASYELFKDLPTTRLATDIGFLLDTSKYAVKTKKTAIVSIIDCDKRFKGDVSRRYDEKIIELTENLTQKGYKVTYMSFCKHEGDEVAIKRIYKQLPSKSKPQVDIFKYDGNLDEAFQRIASCEIMVGSRFHATILGLLFNKKVLPIIYSAKTLNVLKDMRFGGSLLNLKDMDGFDAKNFDFNSLQHFDVSPQVELADNQFKELDKVLVRK